MVHFRALLVVTDFFNSEAHMYCDFPENVECGERPLCDENDQNCEERE